MRKDNVTLRELAKIAKPIDESSHSRDFFLQKIATIPGLEKQFSEQYSEEFEKLIEEKNGVYFIINQSKRKIYYEKPTIKLSTCGRERLPTISLNL